MLEVLLIQDYGEHDENRFLREVYAIEDAFKKLGHNTEIIGHGFPSNDNYLTKKYDILFCCENTNLDKINDFKISKINAKLKLFWIIDLHCTPEDNYIKAVENFDFILHSTKSLINEFKLKIPDKTHIWFPNGIYEDYFNCKSIKEKSIDLGFVGTLFNGNNRIKYLKKLQKNHDLKYKRVLGKEMTDFISSMKVHFNRSLNVDVNYRNFETISLGTCLLTNYLPELEELGFKDKENCLFYKDYEECAEKYKYALKDNNWKKIALNGLELAKKHSFKKRIKSLLNLFINLKLISKNNSEYKTVPKNTLEKSPEKTNKKITEKIVKNKNNKSTTNRWKNYKILVKYPIRNRPDKFFKTLDKYINLSKNKDNIDFLVTMDNDDTKMNTSKVKDKLNTYKNIKYYYGNSTNKIEAINADLEKININSYDIILLASDDMIPQVNGYDDIIRKKFYEHHPKLDGIIWFYDGYQTRINTLTIMGTELYKKLGYLYYPKYITAFCDDELTLLGNLLGKQTYVNDCIIKHESPYWTGEEKDELLLKWENSEYFKHDQNLFKKRLKYLLHNASEGNYDKLK